MLAVSTEGDIMEFGSAFVPKDSALGGEQHNRLVSARHVANAADLAQTVQSNVDRFRKIATTEYPSLSDREGLSATIQKHVIGITPEDVETVVNDILSGNLTRSAEQESRIKRILKVPAFDHLQIYGSNGHFLGRVKPVAMGGAPDGKTNIGTDTEVRTTADDWAVLVLETDTTEDWAAADFDKIPGLRLAALMSPEKTWGMSGDANHPAVSPGFSGGPVVDAESMVHGINSSAFLLGDRVSVGGLVNPWALMHANGVVKDARAPSELTMREPAIINPLGDPRLLAELGHAGAGVSVSYLAPMYTGTTLVSLGMPMGSCAASPTMQGPINKPMPDIGKRLPGAPSPLEVRTMKDGSVAHYDLDGLLSKLDFADGRVRIYEHGQLTQEKRPDGSTMEYEARRPVLHRLADGTIVPYSHGRPTTIRSTDVSGDDIDMSSNHTSHDPRRHFL